MINLNIYKGIRHKLALPVHGQEHELMQVRNEQKELNELLYQFLIN